MHGLCSGGGDVPCPKCRIRFSAYVCLRNRLRFRPRLRLRLKSENRLLQSAVPRPNDCPFFSPGHRLYLRAAFAAHPRNIIVWGAGKTGEMWDSLEEANVEYGKGD